MAGSGRSTLGPPMHTTPPLPASDSRPPPWYTLPNANSPIMDMATGTMTIPWLHFFAFLASRATYMTSAVMSIDELKTEVQALQGQVGANLQGEITTLINRVTAIEQRLAAAGIP